MQKYDLEEVSAGPDWWSRLVAVGSLLVAATALWFAKSKHDSNSALSNPKVAALVQSLESEVQASSVRESRFNELMGKLERVTNYRPTTARIPTDAVDSDDNEEMPAPSSLTADDGEMTESVDRSGEDSLDEDSDSLANLANDLASDTDENFAEDESILRTLDTPQLPVDSDFLTASIINDSLEPAFITHVKFVPLDVIEDIPTSIAVEPIPESTDSELSLQFGPDDNVAEDPTEQGTYFRMLNSAFHVGAGDRFDVRIAIKNPAHIGYGLRGTLTLDFNTTESKVIENAVVMFVGRPDAN